MAETVLVIDDDQDFLEATETLLDAMGFNVVTAASSSAAVEAVEKVTPDVILLDVMMERADSGFTLAQRFRRKPELAKTPIIMVTGVSEHLGHRYSLDTPQERQWIRADLLLEKPLRPEDLLGHIRQVLDQAHENSAAHH
ncbi:MAG TPA: response regulator [Candidatus Latescibacteria bacterium]|nr:response regulator [Candidatus Latescibacterota bacterium]